jgi:hypothetical protein
VTDLTDLTISQIGHLVKVDLKYHLIKLISAMFSKTTQSTQIDKVPNQ